MATKSIAKVPVDFNGISFLLDVAEGNLISLTALYSATGNLENKYPYGWIRQADTAEFILAVIAKECNSFKLHAERVLSQRPEKKEKSKELLEWCKAAYQIAVDAGMAKAVRGKFGGGTWAHWKIATKYAAYLNPALENLILDVFRERLQEERDPEKPYKRAIEGWKRQGKSNEWIDVRTKTINSWHSFTDTLKQQGVDGYGYPRCADSINVPLLGGTSKQVKAARSIVSQNLRDHLNEGELFEVGLAQYRSKTKILDEDVKGNSDCAKVCFDVATKIAQSR